MTKTIHLVFVLLVSLTMQLSAGSNVPMNIQPSDTIILKGTSTLHDYECISTTLQGTIEMDTLMESFVSAEVIIPVKTIHSGNSSMDDNMYEALKADDHPEIKFSLTNPYKIKAVNGSYSESTIPLLGKLTIAGKVQEIDIPVTAVKNKDGEILVRGKKKLLMTDFDIDPPSFMLGLLKTGDEVTVEFVISLRRQNTTFINLKK